MEKIAYCQVALHNDLLTDSSPKKPTMSSLRRLVAGLSLRGPGFYLIPIHVGFEMTRVALGKIYFPEVRICLVIIIPTMFHFL